MDKMKLYFIFNGEEAGMVFMGIPVEVNCERRIWNTETANESYYACNCIETMIA